MKLKTLSDALLLALTAVGGHLNESARAAGAATFLNVVARASTRPSLGSPAY
jgi:hypothetical protein